MVFRMKLGGGELEAKTRRLSAIHTAMLSSDGDEWMLGGWKRRREVY